MLKTIYTCDPDTGILRIAIDPDKLAAIDITTQRSTAGNLRYRVVLHLETREHWYEFSEKQRAINLYNAILETKTTKAAVNNGINFRSEIADEQGVKSEERGEEEAS